MKKIKSILVITFALLATPLFFYKYPLWGALFLCFVPVFNILRVYLSARFMNGAGVNEVTRGFIVLQSMELIIGLTTAYFIGMFYNYLLQKFNIVIPYLTV